MNRIKRHKVKTEKPETSTSYREPAQDYDLTYYIHDRVELMHQVFSVLKHKELKAIAPECVRHISIDDLQELCTEELLGISSKRLCAILDGAQPPSDTDSSSESEEKLETISLDSISSDEEILSEGSSKKKKHKRHHRDKKAKKTRKREDVEQSPEKGGGLEQSRAARAGLTVLELLELQARARAIRAQLHQEQAAKQIASEPAPESTHSSDNEVEIKEEPAEVVEISSEDEKPDLHLLNETSTAKEKPVDPPPVTKRVNDLVITVPQARQARKIKLNRNKMTVPISNDKPVSEANTSSDTVSDNVTVNNGKADETTDKNKSNDGKADKNKNNDKIVSSKSNDKGSKSKKADKNNEEVTSKNNPNDKEADKAKEKQKKRTKKKNKKKTEEKDSDDDEITLQLSDTEKMDLLEDLDRKNFEIVSSSGSEDSESSSSESSDDETVKEDDTEDNKDSIVVIEESEKTDKENQKDLDKTKSLEKVMVEVNVSGSNAKETEIANLSVTAPSPKQSNEETSPEKVTSKDSNDDDEKEIQNDDDKANDVTEVQNVDSEIKDSNTDIKEADGKKSPEKTIEIDSVDDIPVQEDTVPAEDLTVTDKMIEEESQKSTNEVAQVAEKELSDGEISDRASSEVEAVDLKPEVVCISDTEEEVKGKKKKKKEKKSKSKKSKKSKSDFRESGDQNFFKENEKYDLIEENDKEILAKNVDEYKEILTLQDDCNDINKHDERNSDDVVINNKEFDKEIIITDADKAQNVPEEVQVKCEDTILERTVNLDENYDDVYEILELSDDSSCYEVEGTVLSKEPTAEEIEALSARIDEIEREDVITEEEIRQHERLLAKSDVENISWKDRYLESAKVKRVLSTANIFNALRKKNIELKKKLEESKKKEEEIIEEKEPEVVKALEEGSIEQYNTLQGSTKFVDPVQEAGNTDSDEKVSVSVDIEKGDEEQAVSNGEPAETPQMVKEMRKDAKQLLKMYKMLLKYNDVNKKKDPSKKKKKKSKKKSKESATTNSTT